MTARAQKVVGTYRAFDRVFDDEELDEDSVFTGYELDIDDARRIELDDGRIAFVFERLMEDDVAWEGRLECVRPGSRRFTGTMSSPGLSSYQLDTLLWISPHDDEWLLLGTYVDPEDGERIDVSFTFEPDDDEE
jgi:hypothetical protein